MTKTIEFDWQLVSETSLLIRFDAPLSRTLSQTIGTIAQVLLSQHNDSIMNVTPSHNTLLIDYLPYRISPKVLILSIDSAIRHTSSTKTYKTHEVVLPAYYHPEVGLDIHQYEDKGLSLAQLIESHTQASYYVSALGFAPGFAFLAGLPNELILPRLATPRVNVPIGTVAIADQYSAVYPDSSPGGWNLIGRCPLALFQPQAQPITPFSIGGQVRFTSISRKQFLDLGGALSSDATYSNSHR
jgi:KipI family sensor histidine kinase inhibitor